MKPKAKKTVAVVRLDEVERVRAVTVHGRAARHARRGGGASGSVAGHWRTCIALSAAARRCMLERDRF